MLKHIAAANDVKWGKGKWILGTLIRETGVIWSAGQDGPRSIFLNCIKL